MSAILVATQSTQTHTSPEAGTVVWNEITAEWALPKLVYASTVGGMPIREVLSKAGSQLAGQDAVYTRYASLTVTTTFQGRTAGPRKVLFLFGSDKSGKVVVAPQDLGVQGSALGQATTECLYPEGLLRTRLRGSKCVGEWLSSHALEAGKCSAGERKVCCTNVVCGVTSADLVKDLATPLSDQPR